MKKIISIVMLLSLMLSGAVNAQEAFLVEKDSGFDVPVGTLTMERSFEIALKENPGLAQADLRIRRAHELLQKAKTAWLPVISVDSGYDFVDVSAQPDTSPAIRVKDAYREYRSGLRLSWLIFDGFARESSILAAKAAKDSSVNMADEAQRLLLRAVGYTFYGAQLAVERMIIAEQDRRFNQILEDDAERKFKVGSIPEAEMLNFSVKVLRAESDFQEAQRTFRIACTMLAELLGYKEAKLPEGLLPVRVKNNVSDIEPDFDNAVKLALKKRTDLKSVVANIEVLKYKKKQVRARFFPTLSLQARADYIHDESIDVTDRDNRERVVGVFGKWDIFDGGRRFVDMRQVQAQIEEAKKKQLELELAVRSEIRQTIENIRVAADVYSRKKKERDLVSKIREHVEKSYKAGVDSLTRLNEVQTDLVRASGAVVAARISYLREMLNLEVQTGRILDKKRLEKEVKKS